MNIILPIGGIGDRFCPEYELPKPLILVNGKPMVVTVIENLHITIEDVLYIAYQTSLDKYDFQHLIRKNFPELNIRFIVLDGPTYGAPDTLRMVLLSMTPEELELPVVSMDVDTIYLDDVLRILKIYANDQNAVTYFETDEPRPIYSYIELNQNRVINIREKEKISNKACSGAYKFVTGKSLLYHINILYAMAQLADTEQGSREKYTSAIYRQLILCGVSVFGYRLSGIDCVGTPEQLTEYHRKKNG